MAGEVEREGLRRRVRLSSRNQITIPVSVRREMGVQPGDELEIAQNGREAILRPAGDVPWMRFAGSLPGMWPEGHLDALRDEWDPANPIADLDQPAGDDPGGRRLASLSAHWARELDIPVRVPE
jgi:AbrB family looped-hinge helix DNA binding protein